MNAHSITSKLSGIGLGEKSALIYATLLDLGGAYPSRLAEVTKLNRSTVYKVLLDLSVKGLVTEIERGKKLYYQIEKPEKLTRFAKLQADRAHDAYKKTQEIMPDIEGMFNLTPNKPRVRYFQDMEGIKSIFEDHVTQPKPYEMLGFANATELEKFAPPGFLKKYIKRKEQKNITTRGIVPDLLSDKTYTSRLYQGIRKEIWLKLRHIPKKDFPFNGEITIYGEDKVSIINFNDQGLVGVIIEDKAIHEMMVRIFELAWKGAGLFKS